MKRLAVMIVMLIHCAITHAQNKAPNLPPVAQLEKRGYEHRLDPPGSFTSASNNFHVYYYCLHWNIDPAVRYISGSVTSYFTITVAGNELVYDLDNNLIVDSVLFRNIPVAYLQNVNKTVAISLGTSLDVGSKDSLTIYYHGMPPENGFGAFSQTKHSGVPVLWTLSEPYGARDWWPCRNGLDDKADSIDIYIIHPSAYTASANGTLVSTVTHDDRKITYFKHRYPIATYLIGIAITNYTQFSKDLSLQTGTLPVTTTVYPEAVNYFQNNIQPLYNALQLFDQHFGPYPFMKERYGQTQFSWGGGMEHQTNSFITNADEYLMAHELGHQWFGDKITCASWQDIWLNEGFATWMADLFYTEHFRPEHLPAVVAEDLSNILRAPHGSVWVEDTTSVDRIFDNDLSYKKGAFLLRMLRHTLGDAAFFNGLRLYQNDTALQYGFARTADLQHNLEKASGEDLSYFFNQWFYGKGFPSVHVTWSYNDGNIEVIINQTTSDTSVSFFKLPLDLRFKNTTQEQTLTIDVNKNNQRFTLPLNFVPDTVLIDPTQYLVTYNNTATHVNSLPAAAPLTLVLYPNPAKNILHVRTNSDEIRNLQVQVYNTAGIQVMQRTVALDENASFAISIVKLSAGMYFLNVTNNDGKITTAKFIKY
ncbi:T9SS type A sorting domain-containing protein [Ilyomonas limi]|uniref:Aminopeptidase N n=1 Tax=Ilyomonas limi TaxID=2575867 RepID=A0A4U3KQ96_9BACT|nr:M1 family aminopeptidase [Ilyomonas limi]TKK64311.1 T9SS type A sorting domain-containing protein [Ilyomonas limi]